MATGPWVPYGPASSAAFSGDIDLDANPSLFMMFTAASHVPDRDHAFESQLTDIVSGTNLPAAGVAVTGTVAYDSVTDTSTFAIVNVTVNNVTATGIRNLHIVDKSSGNAATNRLVAFCTLDEDLSPDNGTLVAVIPDDGVFDIGEAA